ncbi:HNH endonuclease [Burkholderiaceae bacterium UC74_6]
MANFYWVNQGSTFHEARVAGCLWAPELDAHGATLNHWQTMTRLQPGDVILTYANGHLKGYAVARSRFVNSIRPYRSSSPYEPGQGGRLVFCDFKPLAPNPVSIATVTKDAQLRSDLSTGTNSVLTSSGTVAQKYLCQIPASAAAKLLNLMGIAPALVTGSSQQPPMPATSAVQLVNARVGQGKFRADLLAAYGGACAVTGLTVERLLRASHIRPWCESSDFAKLDPENGVLLAAGVDAAFDCGLVSFDKTGALIISGRLTLNDLLSLGIPQTACLASHFLTQERQSYLAYHRSEVFKAC